MSVEILKLKNRVNQIHLFKIGFFKNRNGLDHMTYKTKPIT